MLNNILITFEDSLVDLLVLTNSVCPHTYTENSLTSSEKILADLLVFINSVGRENSYNSVLGSNKVLQVWKNVN